MQFLLQGAKTQIVSIFNTNSSQLDKKHGYFFTLICSIFWENELFAFPWIARSNYIKSNIEHFGLLRVSKIFRKLNQRVLFHILTSPLNVSFIEIGCLVAVSHQEKQSAILIHEKLFFHHVSFLWINQTASWRSKWRKIFTLGKFFSRDMGITWPKIFLQNNCESKKYLVGARARFTRTRLLGIQFNYSSIHTWRSKFLTNRKTTFTKTWRLTRQEKLMRRYHETKNVSRECTNVRETKHS